MCTRVLSTWASHARDQRVCSMGTYLFIAASNNYHAGPLALMHVRTMGVIIII